MPYAPGISSLAGQYAGGIGPSIGANIDEYLQIERDIANAKQWSDAANQFLSPEQKAIFGGQIDAAEQYGESNPFGQYLLSRHPAANAIHKFAERKRRTGQAEPGPTDVGADEGGALMGGAGGATGGAGWKKWLSRI